MGILRLLETFSEKVSNMTENNENQVGDVSCDEVEVGRFIHDWLGYWYPLWMSTDVLMREISDTSKLCIFLCFLLPFVGILGGRGWSGRFILCPRRRHTDTGHGQGG